MDDIFFMKEALKEAQIAYSQNEVPIGCVITREGIIIGRGYNNRATKKNVLCHAEITAINEACTNLSDWRLEGCRLYVTIEPCAMCAGAILQARIPILIFGAKNIKAGCAGSVLNLLNNPGFNHQAEIISGVLEEECSAVMKDFFLRFRG